MQRILKCILWSRETKSRYVWTNGVGAFGGLMIVFLTPQVAAQSGFWLAALSCVLLLIGGYILGQVMWQVVKRTDALRRRNQALRQGQDDSGT